jgi:hypothetical protein
LQFHHDKYYAAKPKGPIYEAPKGTLAGGTEPVKLIIDFEKGTFVAQIKCVTPDGSLAVPVPIVPVTFGITFTDGITHTGYKATDNATNP